MMLINFLFNENVAFYSVYDGAVNCFFFSLLKFCKCTHWLHIHNLILMGGGSINWARTYSLFPKFSFSLLFFNDNVMLVHIFWGSNLIHISILLISELAFITIAHELWCSVLATWMIDFSFELLSSYQFTLLLHQH